MKAALFLQDVGADGIFRTKQGDLISEPSLRGNVYLKGLLLAESSKRRTASITGKRLKFGYNFSNGQTNRERQALEDAQRESQAILTIWQHVLLSHTALVPDLVEMLDSDEPEYADVSMAEWHLREAVVLMIKDHLLGDQFAGKWYYAGDEGNRVSLSPCCSEHG